MPTKKRGRPKTEPPAQFAALGSRIRRARELDGLTVPQAAVRAGVRPPTWYSWEQGRRWPDVDAVATALGLPPPLRHWPVPMEE